MDAPEEADITYATNYFINEIYKNGFWQWLMFFLIEQSIMYSGVFIAFSGTFTAANIDYTCDIPVNRTYLMTKINQCQVWNVMVNKSEPCQYGYKFDPQKDFIKSSLKSEFQLICDRSYLVGISQSCVMAGFFIGGIAGPLLADKIGRRFVLFIGFFVSGSISIALGLVNNIYLFIIGSLLSGIMREVTMSAGFVYSLEFMPNFKQSFFGLLTQILWVGNITLLGIVAFFIRDWRQLQIIGSFPIFLSGLLLFIVPESPRWLIAKGQFEKLSYIVDHFANKINKSKTDSSICNIFQNFNKDNSRNNTNSNLKTTQLSPLDIFRSKILFFWTLILILSWIFIVLSYYGSTMLMTSLPGNKYLSFTLSSCLEIPSLLLTFLIIQKGRNSTMLIFCVLCSMSMITVGFISRDRTIVILILSMISKGTLIGLFYIIVVTSIYIYPTTIRSFGTSLPSALGKLFAVIVPYFLGLQEIRIWLPTLIIGVSACFIGVINLLYPDWTNKPLPETLWDLNALKKTIGISYNRKAAPSSDSRLTNQVS